MARLTQSRIYSDRTPAVAPPIANITTCHLPYIHEHNPHFHDHTIGINAGDKNHETRTLNAEGEIVEHSNALNNHAALIRFSKAKADAKTVKKKAVIMTACKLTSNSETEPPQAPSLVSSQKRVRMDV